MYIQIQHLEDYQLATTQQSRGRNRSGGNRRRRSSNNRNRGGGGANGAPVLPELTEEEMKSQLGDLGAKTTDELRKMALEKNLKNGIPPRRTELILELLTHAAEENDLLLGAGILDVMNDGYGFLRQPSGSRGTGAQEIYVAQSQVRRFNLRTGDLVAGQVQAPAAKAIVANEAPPLPDKPSIAVLPFQNMSGDPEQEYFADGMTEDIITGLS